MDTLNMVMNFYMIFGVGTWLIFLGMYWHNRKMLMIDDDVNYFDDKLMVIVCGDDYEASGERLTKREMASIMLTVAVWPIRLMKMKSLLQLMKEFYEDEKRAYYPTCEG